MNNLTVKAYYFPSPEIRRFHVPYLSNFTVLREKLLAHLPQERRQNRVTVKYLDDEDEWVTICDVSDEDDWKVVKTSFKKPIVRLRVYLTSSPLHEPTLVPPMSRFGGRAHFGGCHHKPAHWGVVCDGCEMRPIRGIRYKCNECPDFDFCETCFDNAKDLHDPSHTFQRIESYRHHHGRRWNLCRTTGPRQESPAYEDPLQSATVVISNQSAEDACQSEESGASQEQPIVIEIAPDAAAAPVSAASPAPDSPSNSEPVSSSAPLPPASPPVVGRANVQSAAPAAAAAPASESIEPHPTSRIWNMISPLIAGANNDAEPEFANELATLEAMGLLDDRERALRLLRRRRGNLQLVVNELLQ